MVGLLDELWGDHETLVVVVREGGYKRWDPARLRRVVRRQVVQGIDRSRGFKTELTVIQLVFDDNEMLFRNYADLAAVYDVALPQEGVELSVDRGKVVLEREVPWSSRGGRGIPFRTVGRQKEFVRGSG